MKVLSIALFSLIMGSAFATETKVGTQATQPETVAVKKDSMSKNVNATPAKMVKYSKKSHKP